MVTANGRNNQIRHYIIRPQKFILITLFLGQVENSFHLTKKDKQTKSSIEAYGVP